MSNHISHHIATLLRRHDCVIVPGVGAFVCTYEASRLEGELLTPPCRPVTFNPAMTHDDGLLADSYARRLKISFEQARQAVADDAALIQRRLQAEGAVDLPRVGTLQRKSGGRLEFIPEGGWTLPLAALRAVGSVVPAIEIVPPVESRPQVAVVKVPLHLRWIRQAAAVVILCTLAFALSTPIDLAQAQRASLTTPMFTPPVQERVDPLPVPQGLELNIAMAPKANVIESVVAAPEPEPAPVEIAVPAKTEPDNPAPAEVAAVRPSAPKPYVIVVASFGSMTKAQEQIANLRAMNWGKSFGVIGSGKNYRVYAAEGNTPQEARAAANAQPGFNDHFPDSWVCAR